MKNAKVEQNHLQKFNFNDTVAKIAEAWNEAVLRQASIDKFLALQRHRICTANRLRSHNYHIFSVSWFQSFVMSKMLHSPTTLLENDAKDTKMHENIKVIPIKKQVAALRNFFLSPMVLLNVRY